MRSRAARVAISAIAWLAAVAAGVFLFYSEQQLAINRGALRAFDARTREATTALGDLRAAQQAYVAAGQGVAYWIPKVAGYVAAASQAITDLRTVAVDAPGRASLDDAAARLAELKTIDQRARDYIQAGQPVMAGDVIFTDAAQNIAEAHRYIESARDSARQFFDRSEADARRLEAAALGGAAVVALIAIVALVPAPRRAAEPDVPVTGLGLSGPADLSLNDLPRRETPALPANVLSARAVSPILRNAAQLCTEIARVTSIQDLTILLGRAADMLDASGLVVWLGNPSGADLRPVLAHGYTDQALARMPTVPRGGDNAAAAAYRTGTLQIVLSRPGIPGGAIVAPLLGPDGCIGALSAEITGGGEGSEAVQALSTLFAAQLAAVLAAPQEAAPAAHAVAAN